MKKLSRLLLRLVLFSVVIIAGLATMKTLAFTSRQVPVEAITAEPVADEAAQRLAGAVQFPTVSYEEWVDTAAFRGLDTFLRQQFPLVDSMLELTMVNAFSRVYRWAGQNAKLPPILLMGHLDVVPVEASARSAWQADPFGGELRDGHIWGRGTLDDKISCLATLEAVEALLREDYTPVRTVYLAFGHDEEVSGHNGAQRIARRFEEQKIRFDYVLDEGMIILEEALPGLSKPLAMIGVAEKGFVTLRLAASLEDGGHSSMPPPLTAVGLLARAIDRLQSNPFPSRIDGAVASMFDFAGPEMRPAFRVAFANRWLTGGLLRQVLAAAPASNAMIRTTIAPTMLSGGVKDNVLPTQATATINFRILPGETVESVIDYVQRTIGDDRVRVEMTDSASAIDPSPVSGTGTFGFQVVQKTIQEIFPEVVVAPSLLIGATDSRYYTGVSDNIYRFIPVQLTNPDLKRVHGIDERISVENYRQAVRFYGQLIRNSCK